jgi:stage III sporulation protein AE
MKKLILIVLLILVFPINVQALETSQIPLQTETNLNSSESMQVQGLYDYLSKMKSQYEILNDMDAKTYISEVMKSGDGKFSLNKIIQAAASYGFKELQASMKLLILLVLIALICALLTNLQGAFSNESLTNIAYFACYSLVIVILAKSFYVGVDAARTVITGMCDFMTALMPVLIMLLATVGSFAEATVMDPIILGGIELAARLFTYFLIPIICMGFVLQFVNNLSEDYKIDQLTKLINKCCLWAQGLIITIFVGIITIRGITSSALDQFTARTAKFAVDNFVPIVGKSISDAVSSVAGYSLLLKNSLSSLGLIILVLMLVVPLIKLLFMAFLYKLTAALIEPISDSRIVNSISAAGDSLMLILSCVICVSLMFFIMVAIIASAGKLALAG